MIRITGKIITNAEIMANCDPKFMIMRRELYPAWSKLSLMARSLGKVSWLRLKTVKNQFSKY